ncbi:tyrosine-type recombinase/integrase [Hungatella hathewayi]|uniref:tyrosine-type recombinase/integrase n=1 Tax=Hungatella hathewayi TaxID=154046 RepID=UPI0018A03B54|nr:tyrosine-type recombinase/integrase [Hungatella hathewayi]
MPTAKKLPSGSWRCLAYSHTERILDEKTGKWKDKRIYESFTSEDPSPRGKKEAEYAAAEFQLNKKKSTAKQKHINRNKKLTEAIDEYIKSRESLKRSPTTVQDYRCIQRNAFQDLMDMPLKDIDVHIMQEAINVEARRPSNKRSKDPKPISSKRVKNEWILISAVLHRYCDDFDFSKIELPQIEPRLVELPPARKVLDIIRGTDIELPVLLAAWLSFSMSEVRGLTKSKSIRGNCIMIREVVVDVDGEPVRKNMAKNSTRNRRHRIPPYIMSLIDQVEGDALVPISGKALYHRWIKLQDENSMDHITFHDLRHLNASIMALLRIPDKYAEERGGWDNDKVMKRVYMQTFSEERERFDDVIDGYFSELLGGETDAMQHEMQHEEKRAL